MRNGIAELIAPVSICFADYCCEYIARKAYANLAVYRVIQILLQFISCKIFVTF